LRERLGLLRLLGGYARLARRLGRMKPVPPPGDRRLAMISAYPPGHYGTVSRLTRWIPHLEARGWTVDLLCPCTDEEFAAFGRGSVAADLRYHRAVLDARRRDLPVAAAADAILLHRGIFPFGPWQRPTFEKRLAALNPRIVYDFYDSIWVQREAVAAGAKSRIARWLNPPDLVPSIIGTARAVTVSSGHLAEYARRHHDDVHVLPMTLEPGEYEVREHAAAPKPVLGWMGGRGNLERLRSIAPALAEAGKRADFVVRAIAPERIGIEGVEVESLTHPWSPSSERQDLAGFDVGLLPMFDDAEDRGKFPLKLIQYAAAGLPIVASPVAIDPEAFVAGESILYAETEPEWVEAIVSLATDAARRAALGTAARKVLETRYSFAAHADAFDTLLAGVR
jgi:glycosyltransferase involved in cell wall biosynthesis